MTKKQYTEGDIFKNVSDDDKNKPIISYDLPHDDTSENGVIGSIFLKPSLIGHSENLKPKMFFNEELSILYDIAFDLFNVDGVNEIDDYTVISKLESSNKYKKMTRKHSTKELREIFKKLRYVGTTDLNEYIRRCGNVMNMDFRRTSHIKLKNLSKDVLYNLEDGMNIINLKIQDDIMKLSEEYLMENSVKTIDEVIDVAFDEIKNRSENSDTIGFPSKFDTINTFFKYERTELIIIGGRAKSGKSMFFLNEIVHKLEKGVPCAIFDTEMQTRQFLERFLSLYTGISVTNIKNKRYNDKEFEKLVEAKEWLKSKPFAHIYDPEWTQEKILTTTKILQRKIGLDFLVYDYIKTSSAANLKIQEHNYLGDMTNFLKNNIAGKLNIAVLAGAQMSPKEIRLADSDKLNRYASVVAYWMKKTIEERQSDNSDGTHKIFIEFNRLGGQFEEYQYIDMHFDGDHAKIKQMKSGLREFNPF